MEKLMSTRACGTGARLVEPGGLAALRLAVAVTRDPSLGTSFEAVAFRSLSRTATASATAGPESTPDSDTTVVSGIPNPSPPSEPTGELATVMDIVSRAQAGDHEAFGELYDRYVDVVYRYIYYRVSNATLAEDLTSE